MSNLLKTEQDLQEFKTWIEALRSGKYKQTQGRLERDNKFCCLGVACEVLIPEEKKLRNIYNELHGQLTLHQINAQNWLQRIDEDFYNKTRNKLTNLNDWQDFTFNEIADLLEAVYLLKVLE